MALNDKHAGQAAESRSSPSKAIWLALCGKDIEAGHLSREDADKVLFCLLTSITLFGLALVGIIVFSVLQVALA